MSLRSAYFHILNTDINDILKQLHKTDIQGLAVDTKKFDCDMCGIPFLAEDSNNLLLFKCGHRIHDTCILDSNYRKKKDVQDSISLKLQKEVTSHHAISNMYSRKRIIQSLIKPTNSMVISKRELLCKLCE